MTTSIGVSCSNSKQELKPEALLEKERKRRVNKEWDEKLQGEAAKKCAQEYQVQYAGTSSPPTAGHLSAGRTAENTADIETCTKPVRWSLQRKGFDVGCIFNRTACAQMIGCGGRIGTHTTVPGILRRISRPPRPAVFRLMPS